LSSTIQSLHSASEAEMHLLGSRANIWRIKSLASLGTCCQEWSWNVYSP
jgi:hypothetical protein